MSTFEYECSCTIITTTRVATISSMTSRCPRLRVWLRRRQETTVTQHDRESQKQESLALVTPIEIGVIKIRNSRRCQRNS